ncbi:MAG: hypothetical protein JRJ65_15955 [Deltaproteobacteria bacterium]|nr:hypothetical protein [Deltaproteobacteria bacterium]
MNFPQMALLKQTFDQSRVEDIPATVTSELERVEASINCLGMDRAEDAPIFQPARTSGYCL